MNDKRLLNHSDPIPEHTWKDMLDCAYIHVMLERAHLFGGCFASWASKQVANDWDFYMNKANMTYLQELGYTFNTPLSYIDATTGKRLKHYSKKSMRIKQQTVSNYTPKTTSIMLRANRDGWVLSDAPRYISDQIIIVPRNASRVWTTFDYTCCQIGFSPKNGIIDVGIDDIVNERIIKNKHCDTEYRTYEEITAKMKKKHVWGSYSEAGSIALRFVLRKYAALYTGMKEELSNDKTRS